MTVRNINLVAIGGGEMKTGETFELDRLIVGLTGKPHPNALFIPTAANDSLEYCASFGSIYGGKLGCETEALLLNRDPSGPSRIHELLDWADLVYVGGGNTIKMLERWKATGLVTALRQFAESGRVISGLSAGANCWFRYGNTDQPYKEGRRDICTQRIDGLGFIDAAFCPHTLTEEYRLPELVQQMATTAGIAIGVDDNAALQISGDWYRIVAGAPDVAAYKVWQSNGEVKRERLAPGERWLSLAELLREE